MFLKLLLKVDETAEDYDSLDYMKMVNKKDTKLDNTLETDEVWVQPRKDEVLASESRYHLLSRSTEAESEPTYH